MKTYWHCEMCDRVHYVDHQTDADVVFVVNRIRESHRQQKPKCKNTVDRIRVIAVLVDEAVQ